jgi:hypothetical protein
MSIEKTFTDIYQNKSWGLGTVNSPLSGAGSVEELALPYTNYVKNKINQFKINSITDFGHGDFNIWGKYKFNGVSYVGVDVVPFLSQKLNQIYKNDKNLNFISSDIMKNNLPSSEMLISKDCLQHLPNAYLKVFFEKISDFNYLILCNDKSIQMTISQSLRYRAQLKIRFKNLLRGKSVIYKVRKARVSNNFDINPGAYRPLDLEIDPFGSYLNKFILLDKCEYNSPKRLGITKQIYFYQKILKNL